MIGFPEPVFATASPKTAFMSVLLPAPVLPTIKTFNLELISCVAFLKASFAPAIDHLDLVEPLAVFD